MLQPSPFWLLPSSQDSPRSTAELPQVSRPVVLLEASLSVLLVELDDVELVVVVVVVVFVFVAVVVEDDCEVLVSLLAVALLGPVHAQSSANASDNGIT